MPNTKRKSKEVVNFDPNFVLCGREVDYEVRLVFGEWDARKEMIVEVGGNCRGLSIIEAAVSQAYENLPWDEKYGEIKELYLEGKNSTLRVCDDHQREEDFLADLLLAAEIISVTPREVRK